MTQLNVKNLDHLGIIAAVVDELGLVDYINEQLQENDRAKISAGLVVKAMILNGLGFIRHSAGCRHLCGNKFKLLYSWCIKTN